MRFRQAWDDALCTARTGSTAASDPPSHFRTSVHASALFGQAIARLASAAGASQVVDIGAGSGELGRVLRAEGLDVLDIELDDELPSVLTGLVIANEWLDNVPCELAELDDDGTPRYLQHDLTLGDVVEGNDLDWLSTWWPLTEPGDRAEIGPARDEAWSDVVGRLDKGLAVAIDYGHLRAGRPAYGTLTGFRDGRECSPVPDGSCDITAHVALDSLAAVVPGGTVISQREALQALGITAARPAYELLSDGSAALPGRAVHYRRGRRTAGSRRPRSVRLGATPVRCVLVSSAAP